MMSASEADTSFRLLFEMGPRPSEDKGRYGGDGDKGHSALPLVDDGDGPIALRILSFGEVAMAFSSGDSGRRAWGTACKTVPSMALIVFERGNTRPNIFLRVVFDRKLFDMPEVGSSKEDPSPRRPKSETFRRWTGAYGEDTGFMASSCNRGSFITSVDK